MRTVILSLAIGVLVANGGFAQDCAAPPPSCDQPQECCSRCGAQKQCKVVCEMKTVKTSCWVVECEDFCAPLPTLPRCHAGCNSSCDDGCDSGCDGHCGIDHCAKLLRPLVPPKCGKVRCRKKLVKKEITCQVPVYKCVVVCCNPECPEASGCDEQAAPAEQSPAEAPALPLPPPALKTSYLKNLKLGR